MVGEIRDTETARLATQAALTGHLVLSSLHTNDAPGAITRLFNLGIEPYLVGATLGGVLAQRLVRKLCQACREPYSPTVSERRQMEKQLGVVDTLYRPKGCSRCRNLGYSGRIGIYELMVPDDPMVERISQGAPLTELKEHAKRLGMKNIANGRNGESEIGHHHAGGSLQSNGLTRLRLRNCESAEDVGFGLVNGNSDVVIGVSYFVSDSSFECLLQN